MARSKKPDLTNFWWLVFLKNSLYIFVHNRLNALIYLVLTGSCLVLYGRAAFRSPLSWLLVLAAPHLLALYYLDFGLILGALVVDLGLLGVFLYLKRRS